MTYLLIKMLHTLTAALTICGFVLRGYWMMNGSALLQHKATRIAPHIVDTLFMLSGIALAYVLYASAPVQPWLVPKLAGLAVYVVLGTVALKRGKTRAIRIAAFWGAIVTFAYIVGVAVSKSAASWMAF